MKAIERLKESGMTRADIGAELGVGRHAVGRWERGEVAPSGETLAGIVALAKKRGVLLLAEDLLAVAPKQAA